MLFIIVHIISLLEMKSTTFSHVLDASLSHDFHLWRWQDNLPCLSRIVSHPSSTYSVSFYVFYFHGQTYHFWTRLCKIITFSWHVCIANANLEWSDKISYVEHATMLFSSTLWVVCLFKCICTDLNCPRQWNIWIWRNTGVLVIQCEHYEVWEP